VSLCVSLSVCDSLSMCVCLVYVCGFVCDSPQYLKENF